MKLYPEVWLPTVKRRLHDAGPDGRKFAFIHFTTNPFPNRGVTIHIGDNWEIGGRNRTPRHRFVNVRLPNATAAAGARILLKDGQLN